MSTKIMKLIKKSETKREFCFILTESQIREYLLEKGEVIESDSKLSLFISAMPNYHSGSQIGDHAITIKITEEHK